MSLRSHLSGLRRAALCSVARRNATLPCDGPVVTFSFDDFPRTALTVGGGILKHAGACGTYYASLGLMNSVNELGPHFARNDLDSLLQAGHELGNHTFSHVSARSTSLILYRDEVLRGHRALADFLGPAVSSNFSYPFGDLTPSVKKSVGPKTQSSRGIFGGLNGPVIDLNLLAANSLYGGIEQLATAKALLDKNAQRKSWLIFYTHDVQPHPSPWGCTPSLFERVVRAALDSGARISTVAQMMTTAKPSQSPVARSG
jgi:peptidoglycan/xylan/chitin deacetylase (PgdA/CDA1 family)